jgi:hypothetical protein
VSLGLHSARPELATGIVARVAARAVAFRIRVIEPRTEWFFPLYGSCQDQRKFPTVLSRKEVSRLQLSHKPRNNVGKLCGAIVPVGIVLFKIEVSGFCADVR